MARLSCPKRVPCLSVGHPTRLLGHVSLFSRKIPRQFCPRVAVPACRIHFRPEASLKPAQQAFKASSDSTEEPVWRSAVTKLAKIAAVGAVAAVLLFGIVSPADAARSGGRMGGSSFSGRASSSYSGGSSYGRSGGGRSGSSYSGTSRSYGGYSAGLGAPRVGMSSFFISPFGFGYGYPMMGGFNIMPVLFWGIFAVIMVQVVQGVLNRGDDGYLEDGSSFDGRVTVAKVQVGLLGSARELQFDLERIASRADTRSPEGLHYILQETVLALLRNPDYCLYGYSAGASMGSAERAETRFNEYSMEERGKFEQETLVNVGGRSRRGSLKKSGGGPQELIVVTILVAAEGSFKLPKISSRTELKAVLGKLGSLRREDVLAVEVLWTPEEEGDYFTQDDLAYDYPLLNTL